MNAEKILDAYYCTEGNDYLVIARQISEALNENYDDVLRVILNEEGLISAPAAHVPDTDSGLGIGGINNDQSMPTIPSVKSIKHLNNMTKKAQKCRRCGCTDVFDGVMFTNDPSSGLCDDCF